MGRKMKFRGETARQIPFTYVRAHTARARKVLREGERERDRQVESVHIREFTCRHHHLGEFTRGINYVRTVKANIITNVLGFLTGYSRELLIATRHRPRVHFNHGEHREKCDKVLS